MSEREQPYTPDELRERRAQARRQRRNKNFRRARNTVLGTAGTGLTVAAAKVGLHKQDAVERHANQEAAPLIHQVDDTKAANGARDAREAAVQDAIARAQASVEAGEPAPQSGVVDVSEAGVNGYVDLDSGDPTATTTVDNTQMGGVSAEQESETGGVDADGSTS